MQNIEKYCDCICWKNAHSCRYKCGSIPHCASYHKFHHSSKWKRLSEYLRSLMWICLKNHSQVFWWWVASRIWRTSQQLSPLTRRPSCWWLTVIIAFQTLNKSQQLHWLHSDFWEALNNRSNKCFRWILLPGLPSEGRSGRWAPAA